MAKLSVDEYFQTPETLRPMELVYGVVREPAAPRYRHQFVVTHLTALLDRHVRERGLGQVCASPIDVVLDRETALVVQPDILFMAANHLDRIHERIWGAPDLVVEVLSRGTARHDRTTKLAWYARYGVRECWLVDIAHRYVEVVDLQTQPARWTRHGGDGAMRSVILPEWSVTPEEILS
jgi:Uma2 family endonuclease